MIIIKNIKNLIAETPCIVVDMDTVKNNINCMQKAVSDCGCKLRPHIKTHKSKIFANMQINAGASGITCAKVSEAEVMADGGADDIFIAYPLVGEFRINRAIKLQKRVKRLILAVDSLATARLLNNSAKNAGVTLEVRMEVDTGAKRTGIPYKNSIELAKELATMSNLNFTGIYTFKSLVLKGKPTTDNFSAAQEEAELMNKLYTDLKSIGINLTDISAGSTPTGIQVAKTGLVTEVRPGTYIFNDYMVCMEKSAELKDIAVRLYATVVSTPEDGFAVIDGGTKTYPMDIILDVPPYNYTSYAMILDNDGNINNNLRLRRMNEEHGIITAENGKTGLKVGDIIEMIPVHVCTAVNMQNNIWIYDGEKLTETPVDARGMLI